MPVKMTKEVQDYLNDLSKALSDELGATVTATIKPGHNEVTLTLKCRNIEIMNRDIPLAEAFDKARENLLIYGSCELSLPIEKPTPNESK